MDKWSILKERLKKLRKSYETGAGMTMDESVIGKIVVDECLEKMKDIEVENKSRESLMKFKLDGCDIGFVAEAPGDITLKQLLKQCDRIIPDY